MRRDRRGFITVIEVMILLLVVAIVFAMQPRGHRPRPQAKKKACISNMKTIEGATELYLMEKDVAPGTVLDQDTLRREGYLKTEPQCPGGGGYAIRIRYGPDGRTVSEIRCNIHATIDDTTSGL